MQDVSAWRSIVDALATGGPWTLVVIEAFIIRYLFLDLKKQQELHLARVQELNDRITAAVEKQIPLLQHSSDAQKQMMSIIARVKGDYP
jgi:hypothetical protein